MAVDLSKASPALDKLSKAFGDLFKKIAKRPPTKEKDKTEKEKKEEKDKKAKEKGVVRYLDVQTIVNNQFDPPRPKKGDPEPSLKDIANEQYNDMTEIFQGVDVQRHKKEILEKVLAKVLQQKNSRKRETVSISRRVGSGE